MFASRKVLLVKPPNDYYPLGLAYVAATLERSMVPYDFVDCSQKYPDWREVLANRGYFAVASGGLVADFLFLEKMFKDVKAVDRDVACIVGGLVTRDVRRETLFGHIPVDFAVVGEAEVTLPILLQRIIAGDDHFRDVKGIIYRSQDGAPIKNTPQQRVNLAELRARPSFTFFDHTTWPVASKPIPVLTGRGCIGACRFCSPSHRSFMPRLFEDIFQDVDFLINELKVPRIEFLNEVFFDSEDMVIKFCDEYSKRFDVPFFAILRLDMDPRVLPHMKAAGCVHIGVGVESGSDNVLKRMNKGITTAQTRHFVDEAKRCGLVCIESGLMFGYEGETEEDIEKTLALDEELGITCGFTYTFPYPGTAIYQSARRKGLIPEEYNFLQILPQFYSGHEFLTEVLFQKNPSGKPILPNITDIPDNRFVEVLHKAYVRFLSSHSAKNCHFVVRDNSVFLAGTCPACNSPVEPEICLLSPVVRRVQCPNVALSKCPNSYAFHCHIFEIPEIKQYASRVAENLRGFSRIVILGDDFVIKFLLEFDVFGINLENVVGMGTHCVERVGRYVYGDEYGNVTPNSRLCSHEEIVSLQPDAILIALMPPDSLQQRDILCDMEYPEERIFLMCPPEALPQSVGRLMESTLGDNCATPGDTSKDKRGPMSILKRVARRFLATAKFSRDVQRQNEEQGSAARRHGTDT